MRDLLWVVEVLGLSGPIQTQSQEQCGGPAGLEPSEAIGARELGIRLGATRPALQLSAAIPPGPAFLPCSSARRTSRRRARGGGPGSRRPVR